MKNFEVARNGDTAISIAEASDGGFAEWMVEAVQKHGAAVVRGLDLAGVAEFHAAVSAFGEPLLDTYRGGDTPRTALSDGVFTSTDYPARYAISQHNEMCYAPTWPRHLYFGCLRAPETGGATPIGSGTALLAALAPRVRGKFESKGVLYQRWLHDGDGPGRSWQETFETDDPTSVESFLNSVASGHEWLDDGSLRVRQVRPGVRAHHQTGETVWFNQAEQWHPSAIPGLTREVVEEMAEEPDNLPSWASYGDGEPFTSEDLAAVREAATTTSLAIRWRPGDLLMIDNMTVLHGRQPFTGPRRILVAMT